MADPNVTQENLYVTVEKKILVSDLLFFLQNRLDCMSRDDIIRLCDTFYASEDYIWNEKVKFFKAIGKKPLKCRTTDKKVKDLTDILVEMSNRDATGDFQPTCVAIELSNIPQTPDGSVPNSQILSTLQAMRRDFVTRE